MRRKTGKLTPLPHADVFETWFPKHHEEYQSCLRDLESKIPNLKRPYPQASFAASTINVGPRTICWPHRDAGNLVWGLCIDFILGKFDFRAGGHLILHEPRLILELRPGRGVIFPSACITHETIPIAATEIRRGATAYSSGGLWRFIAQGYQTQGAWQRTNPEAEREHAAKGAERWREGLAKFLTLSELEEFWEEKSRSGAPRRSGSKVEPAVQ